MLDYLAGAKDDLAKLRQTDKKAWAAVRTFLEEAKHDPSLISKFTSNIDSIDIGSFRVSVVPWASSRAAGDNLFRVRILDTPATTYRVIHGYDPKTRRIGILAVVSKKVFEYDITSELGKRIRRDWRSATDGRAT